MPGRKRSCTGKHQHPPRQAALNHIRSLTRNRFAFRDTMHAYHCPHCGTWHVGHRRRPRR